MCSGGRLRSYPRCARNGRPQRCGAGLPGEDAQAALENRPAARQPGVAAGAYSWSLRRTGAESGWQLTVTDDGCRAPAPCWRGCTGSAGKPPQLSGRGAAGAAALPGVLPPDELELQLTRSFGIPLYTGESCPDGTVELRTDSETEREQRKYHLRAMLVREMCTMPERGDPDEEL